MRDYKKLLGTEDMVEYFKDTYSPEEYKALEQISSDAYEEATGGCEEGSDEFWEAHNKFMDNPSIPLTKAWHNANESLWWKIPETMFEKSLIRHAFILGV